MRIPGLLASLSMLFLLPGAISAQDTIQRSCNARYQLHVGAIKAHGTSVQYVSIGEFLATPRDASRKEVWSFTARRGCGRTVPNRCRERARDAILACMHAHAADPTVRPAACDADGVSGYPIDDLADTLNRHVCDWAASQRKFNEQLLPRPYEVGTTLVGLIEGDTGCQAREELWTSHFICPVKD